MTFRKLAARVLLFSCALGPLPAAAEIAIAIAGPMKGQFGQFGAQMQAGAEQAVADINAAGGVAGETVVLETGDDGCDAEQARAVANQLVGRGVVFVAGHFCFSASVAASEVYAQEGIVQISPATTVPVYTDQRPGQGIFRLAPRDDAQADVAGRFLAETMRGKRIAFLHDKTAYGKGLSDAVRTVMNDLGQSESISIGFDAGKTDYRTLVAQLGLEGVEVVYLGGYYPEAGLIRLEMDRQNLNAVLVSGDALMTDEFWSVAGPAAEGTLLTYPEVPRDVPAAQAVVAALEAAGRSADRYALTTYAAIQAWAQAANAAGNPGSDAVATALAEGAFDTVLGTLTFDDNGDSNHPAYVWYEWRDGVPVLR